MKITFSPVLMLARLLTQVRYENEFRGVVIIHRFDMPWWGHQRRRPSSKWLHSIKTHRQQSVRRPPFQTRWRLTERRGEGRQIIGVSVWSGTLGEGEREPPTNSKRFHNRDPNTPSDGLAPPPNLSLQTFHHSSVWGVWTVVDTFCSVTCLKFPVLKRTGPTVVRLVSGSWDRPVQWRWNGSYLRIGTTAPHHSAPKADVRKFAQTSNGQFSCGILIFYTLFNFNFVINMLLTIIFYNFFIVF